MGVSEAGRAKGGQNPCALERRWRRRRGASPAAPPAAPLRHAVHAPEEERTSGCTATCCLVRRDMVVVANVGDSRAVLCRGGRPVDLSAEHRVWGKTAAVQAEIARIECVGGWVDDGRVCGVLAVSRRAGGGVGWAG